MTALHSEALRFALVGLAATGVHAGVGVALLRAGLAPLAATALAFALAFQVSLHGHRRWTFDARATPLRRSGPRFAAVALAGLAANAALLSALGRRMPAEAALPLACVLVAGITFVLSRAWAFAARP